MGLFTVSANALSGKAVHYLCAATCRRAGHTELYKDRTLLHSTITLTDALPVPERRHGSRRKREDVRAERRAAQPALWMRRVLRPAVNSKVRLPFFYANEGQRDSDHPPLYQTVSNCFLLITIASDRSAV